MRFDWDTEKERINIKKHKLDFTIASKVFADENRLEIYDDVHSVDEERYITIGLINNTPVVIVVVYTERADAIRIISARTATAKERKMYYDYTQGY